MSATIVFIGGISGVFIGMGVIYLSIKITAALVNRTNTKMRTDAKKEAPK